MDYKIKTRAGENLLPYFSFYDDFNYCCAVNIIYPREKRKSLFKNASYALSLLLIFYHSIYMFMSIFKLICKILILGLTKCTLSIKMKKVFFSALILQLF